MRYPRILIDLQKIRENTEKVMAVCAEHGIEVIGVTKACLGDPKVARAMLSGGAAGLGDSRTENLDRLRGAGIDAPLTLLRLPAISRVKDIVALANTSLNSDIAVIKALGREALRQGRRHKIIIMIDTGDGREGVRPEDAPALAVEAARVPGLTFTGFGTNVACLAGVEPTADQMEILIEAASVLAGRAGGERTIISGGNSSAWDLVEQGRVPSGVNQLRFGELILLGKETARGGAVNGLWQDAFVLETEIIEAIEERGSHYIAALGRQDIEAADLRPAERGWLVLKASSDHLVLRNAERRWNTGDTIAFIPGYESLLRAMTSPFVVKEYV